MIPKIIHYCWLSNDPYPDDLIKYMSSWKEKLPDYEFVLWNFDRFDKMSSKWVQQAFDAHKYAFAADYIRLYAVYNYGGIYLDMDIEVLKSFNDLLENEIFLAYEDEKSRGIEAGCFGAEKGNPVIKECLDYYLNRDFIKEDGSFDILPLPKIMVQFTKKHPYLEILDCKTFTCKSYYTGKISVTNNSYAIHNFAGSWVSEDEKEKHEIEVKVCSRLGNNLFSKAILAFIFSVRYIRNNGLRKFFIHFFEYCFKLHS